MTSRALLGSLGFLSFAAVYNNIIVSPVLVDIARDLGVTVGTAGLLVSGFAIPGIAVSILAGPLSDRYGRKAFLVGGTAVMSGLTVLSAVAPAFAYLLLARVAAGIGAALVWPNINAALADGIPYQQRGRAMGTVIAMNQLATIVGVPLAGLIAGLTSWRFSFLLVGVLGIAATVVVSRTIREAAPAAGPQIGTRELFTTVLGDASVRAAIVSSLLGSIFWFTWMTYCVAFFVERYGLPTATASLIVLVTGVGIVFGSQVGGRLGDRMGHKVVVGWTIAVAGVLVLLLTVVRHELIVAIVVSLVLAAFAGARFSSNTTLLSELAPSARGTLLAVNSAIVSIGIVTGTSIGGILVDGYGYEALGMMGAAAALASAVVVWRFVTERTAEIAAGEAID